MVKSNLLISINNYEIEGVQCVKSFQNIDWTNIECLIFHSSVDSELDIMLELSHIRGVVDKVIYINKSINPLYYCIFTGLDADIYDSEDYLLDSSVVKFLIDSYKVTGMTIKSPNADVETLAKCIATISSSNIESIQKLISNNFWVRTLNTAVSNVDSALTRANQINIDVVEMLGETTKLIGTLEDGQENTSRELVKLKKLVDDMERKARPNTPFIFSTYSVPVTVQKVLYVKSYGNCKFLNSFLVAYQHYLKMSKQYSSKLVLVLPKLKLYMQRYSNTARLAPDSIDIMNVGGSDMYVTFEPKKIVMDAFFNQSADVFIVVDLMLGDTLVEGHMVQTFNAAGGVGDIKRFDQYNLDIKKTIFALTGYPGSIILPYINKYSEANENNKKALYFEKCSKYYAKLDGALGIGR